jgi:hypothetical protein
MARKSVGNGRSALSRAASTVTGALKRVAHRFSRHREDETPQPNISMAQPSRRKRPAGQGRVIKRETDIPLSTLDATYTPPQTSLKTSFRSDGEDRQRDQEFAYGVADDGFNDEDRFTNKSGNPRIGTHGRTYEPDEARTR